MRDLLTTIAELAGATAITIGVALLSVPAGIITGGAALIALGYLEGRK